MNNQLLQQLPKDGIYFSEGDFVIVTLASKVFPVPEGPYKRTPLLKRAPTALYLRKYSHKNAIFLAFSYLAGSFKKFIIS